MRWSFRLGFLGAGMGDLHCWIPWTGWCGFHVWADRTGIERGPGIRYGWATSFQSSQCMRLFLGCLFCSSVIYYGATLLVLYLTLMRFVGGDGTRLSGRIEAQALCGDGTRDELEISHGPIRDSEPKHQGDASALHISSRLFQHKPNMSSRGIM